MHLIFLIRYCARGPFSGSFFILLNIRSSRSLMPTGICLGISILSLTQSLRQWFRMLGSLLAHQCRKPIPRSHGRKTLSIWSPRDWPSAWNHVAHYVSCFSDFWQLIVECAVFLPYRNIFFLCHSVQFFCFSRWFFSTVLCQQYAIWEKIDCAAPLSWLFILQ